VKLAVTRIAAAALATAAFAPWPAPASDPLAGAEAGLAAAERHLAEVEALGSRPEEAPGARALRRFEAGRHQALLGDWTHAAILLSDAVDEPAFRGSPRRPEALFLLADALRRQGACGEARPRYAELLALGAGERRADAVTGALECAVSDRRAGEVEALLAEAERTFGATPPPEVRYLAAKALFQRLDLAPEERRTRAAAAFAQVGEPFRLQASYFQGVLEIERGEVRGSLRWFEACAGAEAKDARQAEVRELCLLAVARVHAELGDVSAAIDPYAAIPWESARLTEALYELAWTFVKGERYGQALRTAAFVVELGRDAPLAPQARLLQGHLLLRLGRHAEATDAYNDVINAYAPVRDELDAILSLHEDPVRTFDEIVGKQGKAFDAAAVFPPVAVKWATTNRDLEVALGLVAALDRTRREVEASRDLAQRIQVLLARGGGLDAVPDLRRAFAGAEAVENDAALLEGDAVGGASAAAARALPPGERRRLEGIREARLALETRMRTLPRTLEAVDERLARVRARVDRVDRSAFRMGVVGEALGAAIDGIERWVEQHRSEIDSDREGRQQLAEELRQHREVVAAYQQELRVVRQEIALARDAAAGADALAEEAHLREVYLQAVDAEAAAAASAPGALAPARGGALARAEALRGRLRALRSRADAARGGIAAEAARRAGELRDRIVAEQLALAGHAGALDGVQAVAKALVGGIARDALAQVRAQFYRLVLEADVGIVDVAWSRKRQRLEKIQELAQQKASELERLDHDWRQLGREVDPP
jgi:tetratricopeptide (TPR) repeat protein